MPKRCLTLHTHVVFELVHIEDGAGGVGHPPNRYHGDFDRVAAPIVDLQLLAVEVPRSDGDLVLEQQRIRPVESALTHRSFVLAKEREHGRHVWLEREESEPTDEPNHKE